MSVYPVEEATTNNNRRLIGSSYRAKSNQLSPPILTRFKLSRSFPRGKGHFMVHFGARIGSIQNRGGWIPVHIQSIFSYSCRINRCKSFSSSSESNYSASWILC
nr:hypothetical protein Q903MT_gene820 [Picea sitchensis]